MCGRGPGPPSCGVRGFHALPDLLMCTLAPRPGGPRPSHAITTTGMLQDGRRHLHGTKYEIQDDSDVRRLPTVYFLQYSTTVPPRFKGKRRLLYPPTHVHRPSLQL